MKTIKILLTGGGTAGHITPAISIAQYWKSQQPKTEFLYVGNSNKMEAQIVPQKGIRFEGLETSGLSRSISLRGLKHNIRAVNQQMAAGKRAREILRDFQPDLVLGTGGYVCVPVMRQAAKMGYPTAIHESNAFVGIATKMVAKKMDIVLLVNEDAQKRLPQKAKSVVTGNPVAEDILFYGRERARHELGIKDGEICILSTGGSLGARTINESVAALMALTRVYPQVRHIHATGSLYKEDFPVMLKAKGVEWKDNPMLDIREFIDDMPRCINAADLIIGRAGANTVNEISCAARASILIPSPNVTENHQYHNAMVLGSRGGAIVIEEKDLTEKLIVSEVKSLLEDPEKIKKIGKIAGNLAIVDANQRIYEEIRKILSLR